MTYKLLIYLIHIDALLTGNHKAAVEHGFKMVEQNAFDIEKFIFGEIYYLSDGGYSRLYINEDDNYKLGIDSVSTEKAKTAWRENGRVAYDKKQIEMIVQQFVSETSGI